MEEGAGSLDCLRLEKVLHTGGPFLEQMLQL